MTASLIQNLRNTLYLLALAGLALVPSCGGGSGGPSGAGSGFAGIVLENSYWGRLVDVFDVDGVLVETDVLIKQALNSDGESYTVSLNPVTQRETLIIHKPWKDASGLVTSQFKALFEGAQSGTVAISAKGWVANGTYTRVARNGSIKLVFSEYLDPKSVNRLTVQVVVNGKIANVRYVVKQETGADGKPKGVIMIDPTITPQDASEYLLNENGVGYEPSNDQVAGNAAIRISTKLEPLYGQTQILTNEKGTRSLAITPTDPVELSEGLEPVVIRVFRTGNPDDPANGFMKDTQRPQLQADLNADILRIVDEGTLSRVTYRVRAQRCRPLTPKVGDVLQLQTGILLVSQIVDDANHDAIEVRGSVIDGNFPPGDYSGLPLDSGYTTFYTSGDKDYQMCWLRFDPLPVELPGIGVDPYATVTVRFSEPIDPGTIRSMDSFVLHTFDDTASSDDPNSGFQSGEESVGSFIRRLIGYTTEDDPNTNTVENGSGRIQFGPVAVSADSRTFTLAPSDGMTDAFNEGVNDLHFALALRDGTEGILDLAGNQIAFAEFVAGNTGQAESFSLDDSNGLPISKYFALRLNSLDENGDGLSEYKGQFIGKEGSMKGRDLIRFSRQADPLANSYIGQRAAWRQSGIMTPLTPGGAVMMTVYGYHHLGMGVTAPGEYNLDVEGLNWSPFGGIVLDDFFDRYSVALAHANRYPDDFIDPVTGYPSYDKSGLKKSGTFDINILGFNQNPWYLDEKIVFDKPYSLVGSNTFASPQGVVYAPWPDFDDTYTWRDNSFSEALNGGPSGSKAYGIPPAVTLQPPIFPPGKWPSIVAPLLMRFRCYPRGDFVGYNGFQVQIMVPSSNVPTFRIFSYGGNGGDLVVPDVPESGTKPTGGVSTGGGTQKGFGPELYWGQVDFVVRVSRVFTHWFAFGGVLNGIGTQVIEPSAQPDGASIQVEWRGTEVIDVSQCISGEDPTPLNDATSQLDDYGEFQAAPISQDRLAAPPPLSDFCATMSDPSDWTTDAASLAAELKWKFVQLRITFVSNIKKDLEPELDAYGFAWTVQ
jgi:hypothetical protein